MLRTCGDYVEDMLIFAQCSINILSNHHKVTSTQLFINCAYKTRTDGLPHVLVTSHNFLELPAEGENLKE